MAQELEQIVELLREMTRANNNNTESFDKLLASINSKLELMDKNAATADLIRAYLGELAKATDDKYSKTMDRLTDIEKALKAIFNDQEEHVHNKDFNELFEVFTTNLNGFYSEARQQKALIAGIETRLADISNDKSDKEDILRTITLLRNDFENLNHGYKSTIDSVNSDLKSILTNLIKLDQSAVNTQIKEQVEIMYKAVSDIVNYLNSIDKRDANLEQLLANVATNENLKITQSVIDSIIKKSEEISEKIVTLANKTDIEELQAAASYMNKKLDEAATKEHFTELANKAESLTTSTDEIKQTLAKVSKDIDTIPDTSDLENSLQNLFKKLESISKDIEKASSKKSITTLDTKLTNLTEDLFTIKNIVGDLNEVVTLKVLTSINDLSFEKECYEIKDHVSKMLAILPQKEDIDRLLENNELSKQAVEDLIKKTDILADRLDTLPTHDDMAALNSNQLSLVENLQAVANKDDIENLSAKADEIEEMIDKLNFDNEFGNIYDKTASIENWLISSKVKENTEEIASKIGDKAEQKDILAILQTVENIVNEIDELSKNVDVKKVNRTVAEVYQMIEELKNDFINTTEMHNDSVIVNLSELQKSIQNIVTGDEFDDFVEDLKAFVVNTVSDTEDYKQKFSDIKELQEKILEKLDEINTSSIEEAINRSALNIEEKLDSISDYLTNVNKTNAEDIKNSIAEIKEILENKKSNFKDFEKENLETVRTIENYLKEIKVILDTSDKDLSEDVKAKLEEIEASLKSYQNSNENAITAVIEKLSEYQAKIDIQEPAPQVDLTPTMSEIADIKEKIVALGESFNSINFENKEEADNSAFVSEILNELGANLEELAGNIDEKLQHGFAYNAELVEEKTAVVIDFINELRENTSNDSELYEKLSSANTQLDDYKQELEFITTDITNSLGAQTEHLLQELEPIKEMLSQLSQNPDIEKENVKENLSELHDSVLDDLAECTKYSKSTYDKLEESYEKITRDLTDTENNLKDFILSDIDSVIIKIDNLREDLEETLNRIAPPEADHMAEFKKFVDQISKFKGDPQEVIKEATKEIATSVCETLNQHHEDLKSMLAVSINNEEIIAAIEELKACFYAKLGDLSAIKHANEDADFEGLDDFGSNQYEKAFEADKNAEIIEELKGDFEKFSTLVKELSEENTEINEVLEAIKGKMETITIAKVSDIAEDIDSLDASDSDYDADAKSDKDEEVIVGVGNFNFVKALELMKLDVKTLQEKVAKIFPKEEQKETSTKLASIPTIQVSGSNNEENTKLLTDLNEKVELLTQTINPKEWLEEIKTYIAGDEIHSILNEINSKIDILTLSDNSDILVEIRNVVAQLNAEEASVTSDPEIQSMLALINDKIDILATNDDYELIEEVRDAIDRIDIGEETGKLLNVISDKIDIIAASDNTEDILDIKESLESLEDFKTSLTTIEDVKTSLSSIEDVKTSISSLEEQFESVKHLSESDAKITSMLENLSSKIDNISIGGDSQKEFEDVKALIMAQTDFIDNLEKNGKTEAVKKCLEKLTLEVNNLVTGDNTKQIQKSIKEMKESIMAAIVTIFEQVSFIEESEDIKDFVEEKTDEINQNLATVTSQLKQITSTEDDSDYVYSMQDIESDLAKLRLALSNLQEAEDENKTQQLTSILENINTIGASVADIQYSITKDDELKAKFERVTSDINSLSILTNQLIISSGETYNALNSSFEGFGKLITDKLATKVDRVTKLLETSHASDKVMRQALIYMGEWIDSASESMNKISTNSEEIVDIKSAINSLKKEVPEQTDILSSIEEKFDEQQERLAYFEKQIAKLGGLEDKFEAQQERIDRLEMSLEKILSAVEDIDDSKVTRKIDKIDKQLAKLSTNIEKLASYVD